jgi:hypothetical protein
MTEYYMYEHIKGAWYQATGYTTGVRFPPEADIFVFTNIHGGVLGPTQTFIKRVKGFFHWVKWLEPEAYWNIPLEDKTIMLSRNVWYKSSVCGVQYPRRTEDLLFSCKSPVSKHQHVPY